MARCIDCKFCRFEEDADENVAYGEKSYSNYSSWYECDYNQKHFDQDKLTELKECNRFKTRY